MNNVIVGSGISGLFAGLLLSEKGHKVTIIEKEEKIGGLLKSYNYGDFGVFDYGMHNFLETGIEVIDKMILDLLPIDQWNILKGDKRDVSGIYFNGKVQFNSPYIDIRNFISIKLITYISTSKTARLANIISQKMLENPSLKNTFFDGFDIPIENMENLISKPVDTLYILSEAFGDKIKNKIHHQTNTINICLLNDFLNI